MRDLTSEPSSSPTKPNWRADSAPQQPINRPQSYSDSLTFTSKRARHKAQDSIPRLLTTQEVATLLRVHRNTVDSERKAGKLTCTRIGNRVLFTEGQVMDYIYNQQQGGKQAA